MKTEFRRSDVVDQVGLDRDIKETCERILKRKQNLRGRKPEQVIEDTEIGLVLEHYLMQENSKFKKAIYLDSRDLYHDLKDTATGEIHECKVTRSKSGWDSHYIDKSIKRITEANWNKSKWMHLATYDQATGVYTYMGVKQIRP